MLRMVLVSFKRGPLGLMILNAANYFIDDLHSGSNIEKPARATSGSPDAILRS